MMKSGIREQLLKKRNALSKSEILEKSYKIMEKLSSLQEYDKSKNIMFFVSFDNEVHTHDMIKEALKTKIVIVPKVIEHKIEPALIADFDRLVPTGKFGILEPFEPVLFNRKNIGIVLVPGIAFDRNGHRIGYGFGHYDRFLKTLPKAIKIGLCFDFQIVDKVPHEDFDVAMDIIVTDEEVIDCRR